MTYDLEVFRKSALLILATALISLATPVGAASATTGVSGASSPVRSSHCRWAGVNSPPGGTSFASRSVHLASEPLRKVASFQAWSYCVGKDWMVGARFNGSMAKPFVWDARQIGVQTPGLVVTKLLDVFPGAPPVIVVSSGTGYNWNSYDFFTVRSGHVVPFTGGIGGSKSPVQMRDSGGAGDFFHFTCSRAHNGAIVLTQQKYGGKDSSGPGPEPQTYEVTVDRYLAESGTRFVHHRLPTKVLPMSKLSFAPSRFC